MRLLPAPSAVWRSPRNRAIAIQAGIAVALVAAAAFIVGNTVENLQRLNVNSGFRFLWQPAGFAINTLFYAALLALPLSFFPIRRRLRARRGRCPKCGYDRTGLSDPAAPCPECGATR